jgi:hypothetical protein
MAELVAPETPGALERASGRDTSGRTAEGPPPAAHVQAPADAGAPAGKPQRVLGGVISAIGRMLKTQAAPQAQAQPRRPPAVPPAPVPQAQARHSHAATVPCHPVAEEEPEEPPPAAVVASDALQANARLMSQLSHGRAGQAPKALGVGSDSRLSVAGSSVLPSRVPSVAATSDSEVPAPAPPGLPPPAGGAAPPRAWPLGGRANAAAACEAGAPRRDAAAEGGQQREPAVVDLAGASADRVAAMVCHAVELGLVAEEEDVAAEQPAVVAALAASPRSRPCGPLAALAHRAAGVETQQPAGAAAAAMEAEQERAEGEEEEHGCMPQGFLEAICEGGDGAAAASAAAGRAPLEMPDNLPAGQEVGAGEIVSAQDDLLAADTSRAPGGAVAHGRQPGACAVEGGAGEEEDADGGAPQERALGVTLADVVGVAVAQAGSARFMRARAKVVTAAAAAAGLRATGRPLRRAVELAEVATAPADVSAPWSGVWGFQGWTLTEARICPGVAFAETHAPPPLAPLPPPPPPRSSTRPPRTSAAPPPTRPGTGSLRRVPPTAPA